MEFCVFGRNCLKYLLQFYGPHFICNATVRSPQSPRLLQIFLSNNRYWNASLIRKWKLHVKIVVLILQETILHGTRKEAQLEHCIVTSVPVPSLLPRLKGIIILLQGPLNQNLPLISSVNFVIKSFQDFTLYVNKKTPNMAFQLIHKCWSGWYHQRIWSRES